MIKLLEKHSKEELFDLFNSFSKKGDIYSFFGISDNSENIKKIRNLAELIGFDLNTYQKRKKENKEKRYCLVCGNELKNGQKKFCCKSCSASYTNKQRIIGDETRKKISESLKKYYNKPITCDEPNKKTKKIEKHEKQKYICENCGIEYNKTGSHQRCCSNKCATELKSINRYIFFLEHPEEFCRGNYTPKSFKKYFMEEQNNVCAICGCEPFHNNKPLVFILDHIDGDASNNRRENLRLICPNCDAQLPTFKSKNKNSTRRNYWKEHLLKKALHLQE